ncbi:MAG TPA: carbon-nitrogen hydrolase family protein [Pirellulales bacterium]|jgi:predicted amidohydrolase|nr:carbon-nitrogen hydrolase family protein [Pirellulales bacterium]
MKSILRVASCQFDVEADIAHNLAEIQRLMGEASAGGARIAHFCEAALSGYAGFDVPDTRQLDWGALHDAVDAVCHSAREANLWVLLGSTHRLSDDHLPHNSVYVINDQGTVVDRYDKRFCTGVDSRSAGGGLSLDHQFYTPGDHATVFDVDGFRCGIAICYDYRFPELYRDLKRRGVEVLFQSFHNARRDYRTYHYRNLWRELVPATMVTHAATNFFWASAVNSTARYSLWGSFFVRPDGRIVGKMPAHKPGILLSDIDANLELWDASAPWRDRAMDGQLHSGQLVDDPRSKGRTCY